MFLLLPNPAHCTAAGEPTSQPTCWAVEAECPEGERGSPEMWMIFHMLYLWRNHISISNSKLSTHLPIFILGTLTRITTRCDFWVRWFFFTILWVVISVCEFCMSEPWKPVYVLVHSMGVIASLPFCISQHKNISPIVHPKDVETLLRIFPEA